MGSKETYDDMPHVEVRLIDRTSHDENPHPSCYWIRCG
jgi:hypothetical protein